MANAGAVWNDAEVKAIVDDYLEMLSDEGAGRKYSKIEHRRALTAKLDPSRTEQSIEFKHANISAIMNELGLPYIRGYRPRSNYQRELKLEIERRLKDPAFVDRLRSTSVTTEQDHSESVSLQSSSTEFGPNEWLVDELYQRYLADPGAVDQNWWRFFADYRPSPALGKATAAELVERAQALSASSPPAGLRSAVDRDALTAIDEAIRLNPDDPDAQALRSELVHEMADPETAVSRPGAAAAEPLAGGYDADEADNPNHEDALGFNDDVKMLCSVLAAKMARPPLSVGLFGEWGSGKSFFMRLMRQRIEKLAATAYQAEKDGLETSYCSHVVQINFNAWHYMDANLWASLAVEIFNRLATPPPPGVGAPTDAQAEKDRVEEERARVLKRLDTYQRLVTDLVEARHHAEQERKRVEEELSQATKRRETTVHRLAAVVSADAGQELDKDPALTTLRESTAQMLGMAELPSSALPDVVGDLRKLSGQVGVIWRLLAKRKGRWTFCLAAAFTISFLVGLVFLAAPGRLVPGAASIGIALAAIFGFAVRVRPALTTVSSGLDMAESALRRAEKLEKQFREQQTKKQIELEAQLKALAVREQNLAAQAAEAAAKEAEARTEEEDLRAGRRLNRFIQERSGSDDYRSHLGLISLLHQDLQQLSTLLQLEENDRNHKAQDGQLPRIDRIILYVDDLDRCPPVRVVEVLQAIHLLLALPLFVVVVGVDPRWLLRSLQRHYRALLTSPSSERPPDSDVFHWASTPQNYLEKIFQIPFAIQPMTGIGFARLVDALAGRKIRPESAADTPTTAEIETENFAEVESTPMQTRHAERELGATHRESVADSDENIDPNPTGLMLTDHEIRFVHALAPLLTTPRAGKRLVNIYRMIRSTQAIGNTSTFIGAGEGSDGDYQAILQLLAIVSGFPDVAASVFAMLQHADPSESWPTFVDALTDKFAGSSDFTPKRGESSLVTELSRLQAGLQAIRKDIKVPDELNSYRSWAPRIARFSFAASRRS